MMKLLAVAVTLLASASISFGQAAGGGVPGAASGGGTVTGVTATSPVTSTGGTSPVIACPTCGVTGSDLSQFALGGTIAPKVENGVSKCERYTGATADVKLNACITDAETRANGNTSSIADARGLGGAQTFVAPVHCGDTSSDPVTVLMPANGTWTWTATGSTTDFDVDYYTGCRLEGNSTQPTGLLLTHTSPNGTAAGVMGPGPGITGSGYVNIGGFSLAANSTAVVGNAVLIISGADNSLYHDMNIEHFSGGMKGISDISANGSGICCGATVRNITTDAEYSGGSGMDLEASSSVVLYGLNLESLSLDHPATGSPAFLCNDTQATGGSNVNINGLHEELNRTSATIATANVITGCGAIHAKGVVVNDIAGSSTTVPFSVSNAYLTDLDIDGLDMRGYTLPNSAVVNSATGRTLASTTGHVGGYFANNMDVGAATGGTFQANGTSSTSAFLGVSIGNASGTKPWLRFGGNASAITSDWEVFDDVGVLKFDTSTTQQMQLDQSGNLTGGGGLFQWGNVALFNIQGIGATPTMVAGAAAGTAPTCTTVVGHNIAGTITCTTGTAPATGTLATITFANGPVLSAPLGCSLTPRNAAAAAAALSIFTTAPSTSSWTIGVGTTPLTLSTAYTWSYICM